VAKPPPVLVPEDVIFEPLADAILTAIGQIVLAGSELDDALSLAMFELSQTNKADGYIMFGKQPISGKLASYEYLLKKYADNDRTSSFLARKRVFKRFTRMRNTLCHGIFVGREQESGRLLFLRPSENFDPLDGATLQKAVGFPPQAILNAPRDAADLLQFIRIAGES